MNEENIDVTDVEIIDSTCFGQYGDFGYCTKCHLKDRCKKFTDAEIEVSRRYKGKYTSSGKRKEQRQVLNK